MATFDFTSKRKVRLNAFSKFRCFVIQDEYLSLPSSIRFHKAINIMNHNFKRTVATLAVAMSTALSMVGAQASGLDAFQEKVNKIAAEKGVPAPDVKKELEAQARVDAQEEQTREALAKVSPIERIVAIDADVIRAIKSKDGKIMYLVDNGRFAFIGKMVDVWNRKELSTIEDIADAVSHIDLTRVGFKLDKVNHISVGNGTKQVVAFVDPQCGWCHKLIGELNSNPDYYKNYKWNFVILPVLGDRSVELSKKLHCAKTTNQDEKFKAFQGGFRAIEALEQQSDCDMTNFDSTLTVARALGVQGVPMVIAPDGRFERGKPRDLKAFLEPVAPKASNAQTAPAKTATTK